MTGIYGVCAVLLSSAGCYPDQALVPEVNAVCDANVRIPARSYGGLRADRPTQTARWAVITALDVITELILLALPVWFISKHQIKASKKRVVVFVFSFRLVVAAFSIATTSTYFNFLNGSKPSIGAASTIAWQEVLLGFSLITASIPCLRSFLWAFMSTGLMTVYGANGTTFGSQSGPSQNRSGNFSQKRSQGQDKAGATGNLSSRLRPDWMEYKVDVRSQTGQRKAAQNKIADNESVGSDGSEQMIIGIHRNVEVDIERS